MTGSWPTVSINLRRGADVAKVRCSPSADFLSELRRKVHKSRQEMPGQMRTDMSPDQLVAHDLRVIVDFLTEEFAAYVVELFQGRQSLEQWPDIYSWEYPGDWVSESNPALSELLGEDNFVYIFSISGNYSLKFMRTDAP